MEGESNKIQHILSTTITFYPSCKYPYKNVLPWFNGLETQTYPNHVAEQNIGIYIRMIQICVWPLKMAALIASSLFEFI